MTDSPSLERGYRRLLACYPRAFRREHAEEVLAVLMAAAPQGQKRPRLAESADVFWSALKMRLRGPGPASEKPAVGGCAGAVQPSSAAVLAAG